MLTSQDLHELTDLSFEVCRLVYLHHDGWRTYILEAISRVGAFFEDQRTYILRVEKLTTESPYLQSSKVQHANVSDVGAQGIHHTD